MKKWQTFCWLAVSLLFLVGVFPPSEVEAQTTGPCASPQWRPHTKVVKRGFFQKLYIRGYQCQFCGTFVTSGNNPLAKGPTAKPKPQTRPMPRPTPTPTPNPNPGGGGNNAGQWLVDFNVAKTQAAASKKKILIDFTGSDWCPPCINLKNKVFNSSEFKTQMPPKYILVKLDSPRDKSKQSQAEQGHVRQMITQFKITGYPTVVITDSTGNELHRQSGYGGQPAQQWIDSLNQKVP